MATIGTWHERESREITHCGEYAGAGHTMRTIPGDYPITGSGPGNQPGMPRWFLTRIDATNMHRWFQNRIGACSGSSNDEREPFPCIAHGQMDQFTLAQHVDAGTVTLAPGWHVVTCGFYSERCGDNAGKPIRRVERI